MRTYQFIPLVFSIVISGMVACSSAATLKAVQPAPIRPMIENTKESGQTASTTPETRSTPTRTTSTQYAVDFSNVHFILPTVVASGASGATLPAEPYQEAMVCTGAPEHISFKLMNYHGPENSHFSPQIKIYPLEDFMEASPCTSNPLNKLRTILNAQSVISPMESILFPQPPAAGVLLQIKKEIILFQKGRGIRLLTAYGQIRAPYTKGSILYAFEGMTDDNRYFVQAFFPISAEILRTSVDLRTPEAGTFPPLSGSDGKPDYDATRYDAALEKELEKLPADKFTPSLVLLDEMIRSIQVK